MHEKKLLRIIRRWIVFYILALVFSGVTAFPIESELNLLCRIWGMEEALPYHASGLTHWILTVRQGIAETNIHYPFLAYGTDWLAFSHLVIAVAFIGPYFKPVRNIWVIYFGMISCVMIIPLALICGAVREIPLYWRMIDCLFGVLGIIPLWILRRYIRQLEAITEKHPSKY